MTTILGIDPGTDGRSLKATRRAVIRWLCNSCDGRDTVADLIRKLDRCSDKAFREQFDPVLKPTYRGTRTHYEPSDPHDGTPCGIDEWWEYRTAKDWLDVNCGRCLATIGWKGKA